MSKACEAPGENTLKSVELWILPFTFTGTGFFAVFAGELLAAARRAVRTSLSVEIAAVIAVSVVSIRDP
ncbi:hypothetical protein [Thiomonas sp. FB-Cd]|uniref:hypothetical protein n=1 Tax=Thiomonas sp. FB-Cd TaxID=1158292 RepID=UPI0018CC29B5|nr:hypothetical protein [Thiomonas sp. FB-Cd]